MNLSLLLKKLITLYREFYTALINNILTIKIGRYISYEKNPEAMILNKILISNPTPFLIKRFTFLPNFYKKKKTEYDMSSLNPSRKTYKTNYTTVYI